MGLDEIKQYYELSVALRFWHHNVYFRFTTVKMIILNLAIQNVLNAPDHSTCKRVPHSQRLQYFLRSRRAIIKYNMLIFGNKIWFGFIIVTSLLRSFCRFWSHHVDLPNSHTQVMYGVFKGGGCCLEIVPFACHSGRFLHGQNTCSQIPVCADDVIWRRAAQNLLNDSQTDLIMRSRIEKMLWHISSSVISWHLIHLRCDMPRLVLTFIYSRTNGLSINKHYRSLHYTTTFWLVKHWAHVNTD